MSEDIGLSELIEQVKEELLREPDQSKAKTAPFLFVESIELELQVTVKKDAKAGVKINVLPVGGVEGGGGISKDQIQKVTVKLSPLYEKQEIKEYFKIFKPEQVLPAINKSLNILKGSETNCTYEKALSDPSYKS